MTAPVLADALGPRARRRVLVGSVVAAALIALGVVAAFRRLESNGQLESELWKPFTTWPVARFFLIGLANTVKAALVSMAIALAIGAPLGLARLALNRPVRWAAATYVQFFRGLPLYLLILFCAYGLPELDIRLSPLWALVTGLSIYNSSVLAEIFRAGILSLDRGQAEAAATLGLRYWQSMRFVVAPQAVRRMVPAIVSQLVTILKDTSLGVLVLYPELLRSSRLNAEFGGHTLPSVVVAALLYITVNSVLSRLATWLEARQRRRYGAGRIEVVGAEDLTLTGASAGAALDQSVTGL
jgi:glutamate transport system permease protein